MSKTFEKKGLTKKSDNISEWYHDVVLRAELAEYSDVKGCMIIRPNGYAIWEKAQAVLDSWFKQGGIQNVYFPIFIPMSMFEKEKEHVEGFSPELAVVTHAGGEELAEPLAVRPTSETVITQKFADWIQSHRDLPMKLNQWCNVVRWEKRTYPFMRTSEFLWQEGHTAHADRVDAAKMVLEALEWYRKFYEEYFAISTYVGLKSRGETFAGADETYSIELVMPDGKALQAATSHYLGEHFAKAFNVQFLDSEGNKQNVHQTSWGFSTRAIGGLVLTHGDDSGLVVPPEVSRIQVVILPVNNKEPETEQKALAVSKEIAGKLNLAGIRVFVDSDFKSSLGQKINKWELQGVPVRFEIGTKERQKEKVHYVRRDNFESNNEEISFGNVVESTKKLLEQIQADLLAKSKLAKETQTAEAENYDDFKEIITNKRSFVRVLWCESVECEAKIKAETKATARVCELKDLNEAIGGKCFACGEKADRHWLFAQSY
ncbi:MAG: proline--tRNA ligase [Candidatus Doudnabacteria bacterium]|nr:proline--tRNA ligase [Candidatus Doudnabacteria bacterium]